MNATEIARLKEHAEKAFIVSFHDEGGAYFGDISAKSILSLLTALEQSQAEVLSLEMQRDKAHAEGMQFANQRESLRTRLEAATKALKPFADLGESFPIDKDDQDPTTQVYVVGDFRRARAAMAEMEKGA